MTEASIAAIILVPLALIVYAAMHLLRLGIAPGELTEAACQRLAGLGMMLLYLAVLMALGICGVGVLRFLRLSQIA